MDGWKPDLYLKFAKERTQPTKDLVARIEVEAPAQIIDLGCGPGNSTAELARRWPDARLVGLDVSPAMIEKARQSGLRAEWVLASMAELPRLGHFDVIFSNAAIQWQPDHETLLKMFLGQVIPGGVLAVQVPEFDSIPLSWAIDEAARMPDRAQFFKAFDNGLTFHPVEYYYDIISGLSRCVTLWETEYCHVMENHQALIDWSSSTAMLPYLSRLPSPSDVDAFLADVLVGVKTAYPVRSDGKVLFKFKSLFFIVRQQ